MTREEAIAILSVELIGEDECDIEAKDMAISALEQPEIIRCKDCVHRGETPIADGRYWCEIHDTFMYYCSDAERREG